MPLGEYKDFDECVRKNSDKEDPRAYCGKIKDVAEGDMTDFQVRTRITHNAVIDSFEETDDGRMFANIRIIKSGTSKNRRTYPPSVVQEAVNKKFWDGTLMFLKHDRKRPEAGDREFGEMVSAIESTSWDAKEQAANGRVEFFDRPFFEKAQRAKDYIGVSINSLVRGTRRVVGGEVFEDVTAFVKSRTVDWVFNPSAGGAILAFEDEDDEVALDWSKVTAEDLKRNNQAVYEAIQKEALEAAGPDDDPDDEGDGIKKMDVARIVREAIEQEREQQAESAKKRKNARELVAAAFEKSGLPATTKKRVMTSFEDVEEFDEAAINEAITAAKEELKAAGAGPHITDMGPTAGGGTTDNGKPEKVLVVHESVRSSFLGKRDAESTKKSDDSQEGN